MRVLILFLMLLFLGCSLDDGGGNQPTPPPDTPPFSGGGTVIGQPSPAPGGGSTPLPATCDVPQIFRCNGQTVQNCAVSVGGGPPCLRHVRALFC